ncbi:MAG: EAL domain-containing protein [Burkholderiaceae bacterium]
MNRHAGLDQLTIRHPTVLLAGTTAALAFVAWGIGTWLAWVWRPVGLWPIGAAMLGWLAAVPALVGGGGGDARHTPGASDHRAALRLLLACTAAAAAVVGLASLIVDGPVQALTWTGGGVLIPALAAYGLSRVAAREPPKGVGSTELRLLGAAVVCAPLGTLLRHFDLWRENGMSVLIDSLFGDLMTATVIAPLTAALAHGYALLIDRGRPARVQGQSTTQTARRSAPVSAGSRTTVLLACAGIGACAVGAIVLRSMGNDGMARALAVSHLLLGLLVARSISGVPGALLLAINACAMGSTYASAFTPLTADDVGRAREIATLLLLGGVFSLQSILHSVSTDSREAARALIQQALRSDLSGLLNQRALMKIVGALLARPKRPRFWLVGVVLPDIARWSDLTDSAAAAELERSVAGRLKATFEPIGARVAHPSSGRFVLTLGDRVDGLGIRQRLRTTLGGQRFDTSEQSIQLRYHAGMVEVPPGAEVGPEAVLTALSMSLQRAANDPTGIHRATVSNELLDDYRTKLKMVEVVSRALDEGRIKLFAERIQPASRHAAADRLHFEVLARVEGDDGKLLQPRQFLPAIWHAGLYSKLDRLVFVRTVAFLAANRRLQEATHLCSINVCGPTLCDPEFPDYVKRCLSTHAVDPRRLMIEITESTAISDLEMAREHVNRLSDMGLAIALDDFGTGLATFDYLKRLKADMLKIDGSFLRKVVEDPLDREIVATIVRIARATGARTVAEWIETPEQRDLATELGVDYLQGHLIARPVPIESLTVPRPGERGAAALELQTEPIAGEDTEPVRYDHGDWRDRQGRRIRSEPSDTKRRSPRAPADAR